MIGNGDIVKGIANNQVVLSRGQLWDRHARVFMINDDPGVRSQSKVVEGHTGDPWVDFYDLHRTLRVYFLEVPRHSVASTTNKQGPEFGLLLRH